MILRVYGDNPHNPNAKTELIRRAEKASVNMAEVREVRFSGVNITKDGIKIIDQKEQKTTSIDDVDLQIGNDAVSVTKDTQRQLNNDQGSSSELKNAKEELPKVEEQIPEEVKTEKIIAKKKKGKKG